ncbi:hypothetical protein CEXT_410651 [Caerostris extrusa]|uniref:Uncharacterized protein n=1 Tax=Caerostris extrusa TaxID=172846 RepID=A0AAV4P0U2_CAEEX|nr:hypothetical protein CEXT_410651 [Caerostris extrusa]
MSLPAPPQQHRGRSDGQDDCGGGGGEGWRRRWTRWWTPPPDLRLARVTGEQGVPAEAQPIVMRHCCLMGTKKTGDTLNDHYLYFIRENVGESAFLSFRKWDRGFTDETLRYNKKGNHAPPDINEVYKLKTCQ